MDYHINAKNKPLGRLASEVATILQGKKSAKFEPRLVGSDRVVLKNYKSVVVTGKKSTQKIYYRHTGYVGHLKETSFENAFRKSPENVIRESVRRMLPKNFLNARRLKNLIFEKNHD